MKFKYIFISALVCCVACSAGIVDTTTYWKTYQPFDATYNIRILARDTDYAPNGTGVGQVAYMKEASGLAVSKVNPNGLWSHNDSGNPNTIYLINKTDGTLMAEYRIEGTLNYDWEDIEVGPGPQKGVSYVYLSDCGDNHLDRNNYRIYRFPEPKYSSDQKGKLIDVKTVVDTLRLAFPSDEPHHNVETLLLDPIYKDLYLVSKYGTNSELFVAPYPQSIRDTTHLIYAGTFPFREATGGDISADGRKIMIRTYEKIFYWKRSNNERIAKLLSTVPELAPYSPVEPQGESVAIDTNGYYTLSEFKDSVTPVLYFYRQK